MIPMNRRTVFGLAAASLIGAAACGRRPTSTLIEGAPPVKTTAPPGLRTPEDWRPPVDTATQLAARSQRTHSPCYRAAMEERALAESLAADDLEDGLAASPDRAGALVREYRDRLTELRATFQVRIAQC